MTALADVSTGRRSVDSYRPPLASMDHRLRRLMAEQPFTSEDAFGCYFIDDSSPYSDVARGVECAVFQEFFGNEPSIMTEAYAPYEAHSRFLLVVDQASQEPAGALRIITHSENGLKTLNDIEQAPLSLPLETVVRFHGISDLDNCWDVGTLAVLKKYRGQTTGHLLSTMLYGLFYAEVCKAGVEHIVTILDKHAYKQLTELFAIPFGPIADSQPFNYLGSESSRAAYAHVPRIAPAMEAFMAGLDKDVLALLKPFMCRMLYGEGLPKVITVS
jgi:hypothetical protein